MIFIFVLIIALASFYGARCFDKLFLKYTGLTSKIRYLISGVGFIVVFIFLLAYGDISFGFLLHLLICFAFSDILGLILKIPHVKNFIKDKAVIYKYGQTAIVIFAAASMTVFGYFNATDISVKKYSLTFDSGNFSDTRIMFVSDLHLNQRNYENIGSGIVEAAKSEEPDVIIFGGDIFDQSSTPDELSYITQITSELSENAEVLCVFGNHDLGLGKISEEKIISSFENAGADFLVDSCVKINGIDFIGRMESTVKMHGGERKSIEMLSDSNSKSLKILIDHQPKELSYLNDAGIDMSFSGHTHNGQIFPFGTLCALFNINELQYGMETNGKTTSIVSSGVGTWGMRVRTQGRSEIVIADVINGQK